MASRRNSRTHHSRFGAGFACKAGGENGIKIPYPPCFIAEAAEGAEVFLLRCALRRREGAEALDFVEFAPQSRRGRRRAPASVVFSSLRLCGDSTQSRASRHKKCARLCRIKKLRALCGLCDEKCSRGKGGVGFLSLFPRRRCKHHRLQDAITGLGDRGLFFD